MLGLGYLLQAIAAGVWPINPVAVRPMLESILLCAERAEGDLARKHTPRQDAAIRSQGALALINIQGPMFQRVDPFEEMFLGLVSTERITMQVRAAAADDSISAIMLRIDSPGGSINGIRELSDTIAQAAKTKPVVAVADPMAASAAFWIAAQATELVVSPGGHVGAVGVFTIHDDMSGMLEQLGVVRTFISAGKFKTENNPAEPLTDDGKAFLQSQVDEAFKDFVAALAEGRGVKTSEVIANFGQGRIVGAKDALKAKMIDRIATFTETLERLSSPMAQREGRERRATVALMQANA